MTAQTALSFAVPAVPENRWAKQPTTNACCVFDALVDCGMFDGLDDWRENVLRCAQEMVYARTEKRRRPALWTLDRCLRRRGPGSRQVELGDWLWSCGWRVVCKDTKIRLERGVDNG